MEVKNKNIFKKNKYIFMYYQNYGNPQHDKMWFVFFNRQNCSQYNELYKIIQTRWAHIYENHQYMVKKNRITSYLLLPWYTMIENERLLDKFFGAGYSHYPVIELIGLYPFKKLPNEQLFEFCPNDVTDHITSYLDRDSCLNLGIINKRWLRKTRSNKFVMKMQHLYFYKQGCRAHRKIGGSLKEYQLFWYSMITPRLQNMFETWETFLYEESTMMKQIYQNQCMWYEEDIEMDYDW